MLKRETWIITFVMCLLAGLTGTATMNAEEIAPAAEEKYFYDNTSKGECVVEGAGLTADGENLDRTFSVSVPEDGNYYLAAWVMGVNGQNLEVYLDDDRFPAGNLPALKKGWQSVGLTDTKSYGQKPISLSEGKHTVTFRCKGSL